MMTENMRGEKMYYDIETQEYITLDQLKNEYKVLWVGGETETPTFEGYLANCTSKNGTLIEVKK